MIKESIAEARDYIIFVLILIVGVFIIFNLGIITGEKEFTDKVLKALGLLVVLGGVLGGIGGAVYYFFLKDSRSFSSYY